MAGGALFMNELNAALRKRPNSKCEPESDPEESDTPQIIEDSSDKTIDNKDKTVCDHKDPALLPIFPAAILNAKSSSKLRNGSEKLPELDLEPEVGMVVLNHQSAKHKLLVKPKRKHEGTRPRSRYPRNPVPGLSPPSASPQKVLEVTCNFRLTSQKFSEDLKDTKSPAYLSLKIDVEKKMTDAFTSIMNSTFKSFKVQWLMAKSTTSPTSLNNMTDSLASVMDSSFKSFEVQGFSKGSIVVDGVIILHDTQDHDDSEDENLVSSVNSALRNSTIEGLDASSIMITGINIIEVLPEDETDSSDVEDIEQPIRRYVDLSPIDVLWHAGELERHTSRDRTFAICIIIFYYYYLFKSFFNIFF